MNAFEQAVRTIRFLSVDAVEKANSGHPGAPMGLAGIAVDLFSRYLRYDPSDPSWPNRDRFVLSCGHASMLLYSVLHLSGYDVSLDDIKNFRQWGSRTPGHPEYGHTPGVETTTGPLGQGFGNAVGMALASKLAGARLNTPDSKIIDYSVYVLASDGDVMEGVASEAASIAGHLQLDNLIVIYDDNGITIDGQTKLTFSDNVAKCFEGHGWDVQRVNGHEPGEVRAAIEKAQQAKRPALIIAKTHIGYGAPNKQDSAASHGAPLGKGEAEATKRAADWPLEPAFHVPAEAKSVFVERVEHNQREHAAWKKLVAALNGERAELWQRLSQRTVPKDIFAELVAVAGNAAGATRSHAGKVQQRVASLVPSLVGGSADLAGSVKTTIKDSPDVVAGDYAGKNLHFGIREHGMAAVLNGLALSGFFIPFGSTFLIFSDYMRPSIRLAALMRQQVVYVFSHDSVFLGEDGPTHQPAEQLWTLRLVPNLDVVRPADALESAAAWAHALERRDGPTVLSLTRHDVPALDRGAGFDPARVRDGAYVLADAKDPELVIIATGSEVHVAVEAKKILDDKGKPTRVVSAPCWEQFERLPEARRREVLPEGVRRVSLELSVTRPWRSVVGLDGITIGVDRFGVSAPWQRIADELGFVANKVVAAILAQIN